MTESQTDKWRNVTPWKVVLTIYGLAVTLWLTILYGHLVVEILIVVFGAFLLSLALRPAARFFTRWRVPKAVTVLIIYLLLAGAVATLTGMTGTAITGELLELREQAPDLIREALTRIEHVPGLAQIAPSLDTLGDTLSQQVQGVAGTLLQTATGVGRTALHLLVVLLLAFFFTTDDSLGGRLLNWVPDSYRPRVETVAQNTTDRLSRWARAQVVVMLYFMLAYGTGMTLIGVPFATLIAIIGGVLELVPYLGGFVALALATLSALTVRPALVIWVLVLHAVVTVVEHHIVLPNLYGRAVDVHPALIVIALLAGASVGGLFGALFAVPVTVVVITTLEEIRQQPGNPAT